MSFLEHYLAQAFFFIKFQFLLPRIKETHPFWGRIWKSLPCISTRSLLLLRFFGKIRWDPSKSMDGMFRPQVTFQKWHSNYQLFVACRHLKKSIYHPSLSFDLFYLDHQVHVPLIALFTGNSAFYLRSTIFGWVLYFIESCLNLYSKKYKFLPKYLVKIL